MTVYSVPVLDETPGAGQDEYALCWDNNTTSWKLRQVTIGACLLATGATVGASSQAQAFTSGVKTGIIFPAVDSTTAIQFRKADGATAVAVLDTTNGRLLIGSGTPSVYPLEITHSTYAQLLCSGGTAGDFMLRHTGAGVDAKNWMLRCKDGYGEISSQKDAGTYQVQGILKWANLTGYIGLCMGAGAPGCRLDINHPSAVTNTVENILTIRHASSGTPAAGFGAGLIFGLESSTTENQSAARIQAIWSEATHATRKAALILTAYDTAEREGLRIGANGSAPTIGLLGATPSARLAHVADVKANYAAGDLDSESEVITMANALAAAINGLFALVETFGLRETS